MRRVSTDFENCSGFTFIEVAVVTVTIGVLAGMAVAAYNNIKDRAYHSSTLSLLTDTRIAIEAGQIDNEGFGPPQFYAATAAGPVTGPIAQDLTPGLVLPPSAYVYVSVNPSCYSGADPWCVTDYAIARSCVLQHYSSWIRFKNGVESMSEAVAAAWNC